jgi:serine/threonine protein kinase
MAHPDAGAYPGQVFDSRWLVGEHLGDGNFSIVFKGTDTASGEDCAVKVLSITKSSADNLVEFERDAQLLEKLRNSSNIVDLLDAGKVQMQMQMSQSGIAVPLDVSYIVLERADGDLAQLLVRRNAITWEDRLALFRDVVKGVHQMHLQYLIHRDIKGDNVLVLRKNGVAIAKLTDLGRGRDTKAVAHFPPAAYEIGRGDLRFAPPEFLWGLGSENPDAMRRGDLYLLGSILFEITTGQGLSGMVLGDPLRIAKSKLSLDHTKRLADYAGAQSQLQRDHEAAYALYRNELPSAIRCEGLALLRQLTAVDPEQREPRYLRGQSCIWDLQWIFRRVDRLTLQLRIDQRRQSKLPWKQKGAKTP